MKILENAPQGSDAWKLARTKHFCASEAAAAMGVSKYMTRSALIHQKATGFTEEVSEAKQRLFDAGHQAEHLARRIAEQIAGTDFYPAVGMIEVEGLPLLASFDGIDMLEEVVWENKLRNAALVGQVADHELAPHYWAQLEHQLLVSGASRALFTTSDGTPEGTDSLWYESNPIRRSAVIAAWKQFADDLANYKPSTITEMPKASVTLALPALFIHAKGEITTSNMPEYGKALAARLESVRKIALVTDQDFSDAKEAAKLLRENIESARQAKDAMLAQTVTVGEAARMIDAWCEDMRLTALQLEKDVAREDLAKKTAMIAATKAAYVEHIQALELEIAPHRVNVTTPAFADAIKNKRSFASMQDGLNTMLANAKITADCAATGIRRNLAYFAEHAKYHAALFADKADLVQKPLDYVTLVIASRIADHQAAELAKEEATRARIRAEEQAKAEQAALAAQALADQKAANAAAAAELAAAKQSEGVQLSPAAQVLNEAEGAKRFAAVHPSAAPAVIPMVRPVARPLTPATPPTLKLGQISERLGFSLTGEFLKNLGFEPAARDKSALLFHEKDFALICMRLVAHVQRVQARQAA